MYMEGLHLQAVGWDADNLCLIDSDAYVMEMPAVYLSAVTYDQLVKWSDTTKHQSKNIYICPIFTTTVNTALFHVMFGIVY